MHILTPKRAGQDQGTTQDHRIEANGTLRAVTPRYPVPSVIGEGGLMPLTPHADADVTPVIFRAYPDGDVIALFPADAETPDPYTCDSYMHIGQHGAADPHLVINGTRPAMPHEYADLKRELESPPYGYRFQVYSRLQRYFLTERKLAEGL